jgi:hypothetical protein
MKRSAEALLLAVDLEIPASRLSATFRPAAGADFA